MWYVIIIILAIFAINWVGRNTFIWKTVIRDLWKQIFVQANIMASLLMTTNTGLINETIMSSKGVVDDFKYRMDMRGNIINSILDYINYLKKENGIDKEEETFGYGRYSFDNILMLVKTNPKAFENFK